MTSLELQRLIIGALQHGPLNHFDVASHIDQAPFRVRAELKAMKRERYVTELVRPDRHTWELTAKGRETLSPLQLTIDGEAVPHPSPAPRVKCPECEKMITLLEGGLYRRHTNGHGSECPASGGRYVLTTS